MWQDGVQALALVAPYTRILRSPAFRFLWLGQVVSNFGDTLHFVALVVLLYRLTGSGAALAALSLAQIAAGLALGPVAGVLVDRFDRRRLMIGADLARAGLAATLAFTASAPLAVALAVGMTAVGVPFGPAARALMPSLVDEEELLAANTVSHSTEQATQIVASALAGGLLLTWGTTPAFLVNAVSFAVSAAMLWRLPSHPRAEQRTEREPTGSFWDDARAGLTYARRDPFVGPLLVVQGLAALATGGTSALLIILSAEHLRLSPAGFSWLLLAIGFGALAGPYLLPRRLDAPHRRGAPPPRRSNRDRAPLLQAGRRRHAMSALRRRCGRRPPGRRRDHRGRGDLPNLRRGRAGALA